MGSIAVSFEDHVTGTEECLGVGVCGAVVEEVLLCRGGHGGPGGDLGGQVIERMQHCVV